MSVGKTFIIHQTGRSGGSYSQRQAVATDFALATNKMPVVQLVQNYIIISSHIVSHLGGDTTWSALGSGICQEDINVFIYTARESIDEEPDKESNNNGRLLTSTWDFYQNKFLRIIERIT